MGLRRAPPAQRRRGAPTLCAPSRSSTAPLREKCRSSPRSSRTASTAPAPTVRAWRCASPHAARPPDASLLCSLQDAAFVPGRRRAGRRPAEEGLLLPGHQLRRSVRPSAADGRHRILPQGQRAGAPGRFPRQPRRRPQGLPRHRDGRRGLRLGHGQRLGVLHQRRAPLAGASGHCGGTGGRGGGQGRLWCRGEGLQGALGGRPWSSPRVHSQRALRWSATARWGAAARIAPARRSDGASVAPRRPSRGSSRGCARRAATGTRHPSTVGAPADTARHPAQRSAWSILGFYYDHAEHDLDVLKSELVAGLSSLSGTWAFVLHDRKARPPIARCCGIMLRGNTTPARRLAALACSHAFSSTHADACAPLLLLQRHRVVAAASKDGSVGLQWGCVPVACSCRTIAAD